MIHVLKSFKGLTLSATRRIGRVNWDLVGHLRSELKNSCFKVWVLCSCIQQRLPWIRRNEDTRTLGNWNRTSNYMFKKRKLSVMKVRA